MQAKKHFTFIYIIAIIFWTTLVSFVYSVMINQEKTTIQDIALSTARSAITQNSIFRLWATSHGGFYVPITKKTPPNPLLAHLPDRDLHVDDKNLTLMNPAYALRQMMDEYKGLYGLKGHITSLKLLNPNNAPDDWEKSVLQDLENTSLIEEKYAFIEQNNKPVLRILKPLIINQGCLKCHSHQNYKVGDVRGGVTVMLPMTQLYEKKQEVVFKLTLLHIAFWLFGLLLITYFYRKILQSIAEQITLNNELIHSQENLAQAQHIAKIGHWELDLVNSKLFWSDEVFSIFGISKEKFGSNYEMFLELIHPDDREKVHLAYQQSIEDKQNYSIVHRIILSNGQEKTVEERCEHSVNEDDEIISSLGTVQDITERKNLETALAQKEEIMIAQSRHAAMGEMISMIAHQWRQPITVVSMIANNLLADVELEDVEPQKVKQSAIKILDQGKHLSQTIDDFKNFFRPNKKTEISLVNDILEENFNILGKSLENNNISVNKTYESYTPIETYSRELLQVFINILKNAKEALMENDIKDPIINVTTNEDEDYVYISICDNANGINPDIITKIYDPYFSTKDEKIGTGLGLYMTKTIVEKHLNGNIEAYNREDNGVCFKISLPKKGVIIHE